MTKKIVEKIIETGDTITVTTPTPKKELTIRILMQWQLFTPDPRQYKPSAPVLVPAGLFVGIDVPLTSEFVMNASEIVQAQIASGNGKVPDPILTPIGMRYCIDQVESAMSPGKAEEKPSEDGDWDEKPSVETTSVGTAEDDGWTTEGWSDDDEVTSTPKDAPEKDAPINWEDSDSWNEN